MNYLDYSCSYEKRASKGLPSSSHGGDGPDRDGEKVHRVKKKNGKKKRVGPGIEKDKRKIYYTVGILDIFVGKLFLIGVRRRENRDGHDFDHVRHYMKKLPFPTPRRSLRFLLRIRRETTTTI